MHHKSCCCNECTDVPPAAFIYIGTDTSQTCGRIEQEELNNYLTYNPDLFYSGVCYEWFTNECTPFCLQNEDVIHPVVEADKFEIDNDYVFEEEIENRDGTTTTVNKVRVGLEVRVKPIGTWWPFGSEFDLAGGFDCSKTGEDCVPALPDADAFPDSLPEDVFDPGPLDIPLCDSWCQDHPTPECYDLPIEKVEYERYNNPESVENAAAAINDMIQERFGPQILSDESINPYPGQIYFGVDNTGSMTWCTESDQSDGIDNPGAWQVAKAVYDKFVEIWGEEAASFKFNPYHSKFDPEVGKFTDERNVYTPEQPGRKPVEFCAGHSCDRSCFLWDYPTNPNYWWFADLIPPAVQFKNYTKQEEEWLIEDEDKIYCSEKSDKSLFYCNCEQAGDLPTYALQQMEETLAVWELPVFYYDNHPFPKYSADGSGGDIYEDTFVITGEDYLGGINNMMAKHFKCCNCDKEKIESCGWPDNNPLPGWWECQDDEKNPDGFCGWGGLGWPRAFGNAFDSPVKLREDLKGNDHFEKCNDGAAPCTISYMLPYTIRNQYNLGSSEDCEVALQNVQAMGVPCKCPSQEPPRIDISLWDNACDTSMVFPCPDDLIEEEEFICDPNNYNTGEPPSTDTPTEEIIICVKECDGESEPVCQETTADECEGFWQGVVAEPGACCYGEYCYQTAEVCCVSAGGEFIGGPCQVPVENSPSSPEPPEDDYDGDFPVEEDIPVDTPNVIMRSACDPKEDECDPDKVTYVCCDNEGNLVEVPDDPCFGFNINPELPETCCCNPRGFYECIDCLDCDDDNSSGGGGPGEDTGACCNGNTCSRVHPSECSGMFVGGNCGPRTCGEDDPEPKPCCVGEGTGSADCYPNLEPETCTAIGGNPISSCSECTDGEYCNPDECNGYRGDDDGGDSNENGGLGTYYCCRSINGPCEKCACGNGDGAYGCIESTCSVNCGAFICEGEAFAHNLCSTCSGFGACSQGG